MSYKKDVVSILEKVITKHHQRSHSKKKGTKDHEGIDWYIDNNEEILKPKHKWK